MSPLRALLLLEKQPLCDKGLLCSFIEPGAYQKWVLHTQINLFGFQPTQTDAIGMKSLRVVLKDFLKSAFLLVQLPILAVSPPQSMAALQVFPKLALKGRESLLGNVDSDLG